MRNDGPCFAFSFLKREKERVCMKGIGVGGGWANRPAARVEYCLYRDTLFIIPQIETSPASANLPHNSNMKMDCRCLLKP